jgi:hypothetical protein
MSFGDVPRPRHLFDPGENDQSNERAGILAAETGIQTGAISARTTKARINNVRSMEATSGEQG